MPSVVRPYYHLRLLPEGGRQAKGGPTLCGLPAEQDYHFGVTAWGQEELWPFKRHKKGAGAWCETCWNLELLREREYYAARTNERSTASVAEGRADRAAD
jgi:hypothetical protein